MDETKLMDVLREVIAIRRGLRASIKLIDALEATIEILPEHPPGTPIALPPSSLETPPGLPIDAKRLDRIWKYLQGWIGTPQLEELQAWAVQTFGYAYYVTGQKYPVDLKPAVCDKLNTFTDAQLTELEEILEA